MNKINQTLVAIALIAAVACGKDSPKPETQVTQPVVEKVPDPITINKIKLSHLGISEGQTVSLVPDIKEALTAPRYEWKGTVDGKAYDDGSVVRDRLLRELPKGNYEFTLKVYDGKRTGEAKVQFVVEKNSFEKGLWGNPDSVIRATELANGQTTYPAMIGVISPFSGTDVGNQVVSQLVYMRSTGELIAYFFKDNKLAGGSKLMTGPAISSVGRNLWYSGYFRSWSDQLDKEMEAKGEETRTWYVSEYLRSGYLTSEDNIGVGVQNAALDVNKVWINSREESKMQLTRGYKGQMQLSLTKRKL